MPDDIWKQFDSNTLTHSAAHYLVAVHELLAEQGYARVVDVSRRLNITRGSCSISLKALKKRGLIVEDVNKFLTLSQEGRRLAEVVEINAELLQAFLHEVLGVDRDQAEVDACKIEHLISVETSLRLYNFVNFIRRSPADAETFLAKYRTFVKTTCKGQPRNCELCKSVCMLDDEPVPPVPE